MSKSGLRIPMFYKFLAGCVALALLLIAGGSYVVHHQTRMKARGNYLAKHFKRYLDYQGGLGRAAAAVTSLIAHDPTVRAALSGPAPGAVPDDQ
ncbi:hypothetical protein, partial [Haliangium sp.]